MILAIAIALFASAGVLAWPQTRGAAGTNGPVGETLEALQRLVMDFGGTEPAFNNAFWDNHAPGIYVEARTGEPLFVSSDKFDSGSGWPSFTRPVNPDSVTLRTDRTHGMVRTEVRSAQGGAHLGHVFNDGPRARGGQRWCINSCALRFIPRAEMAAAGYGQYIPLVDAGS
ncbi:MAG: peptide-methionine (R)-S-oxide reductase MsrB [Hyphomonadaceae bacterium]|nr:peptide-methionine (R)-S-oxide reductase MsrB [Hyphomonadaceae bacterium]MBX3511707.1 peptide-methionine (R)-S-oxide reductase MsrB [Hyphomonadaceae bacterium]